MKILQFYDFEKTPGLLDYVNKEIHREDVVSIVYIGAGSSMYTDYFRLFYYKEEETT